MKRILRAIQESSIEVFLALLCLVSGLPILLNPAVFAPTTILVLLPLPLVIAWGGALVLGGFLDVLGIATGNTYMRRAGLAFLAAGAFIMGVTVLAYTGMTRLFTAGLYFFFSWATGARYIQLGRVLHVKRKYWEHKAKEQ